MKPLSESQIERFWDKVDVPEQISCCWEWTRSKVPAGYGHVNINYQTLYAHRIAYELLIGPIPGNQWIDHLCKNKSCCNPDHLQLTTPRENILRSNNMAARHARLTHCVNGHELNDENTYASQRAKGSRMCITCTRAHAKSYQLKRKAARNG